MHIFGKTMHFICRLDGKLPCGAEDDCLQASVVRVDILYDGDSESRRLAGSCLCLAYHVFSFQQYGNRLLLYRCHLVKTHFLHSAEDPGINVCILVSRYFHSKVLSYFHSFFTQKDNTRDIRVLSFFLRIFSIILCRFGSCQAFCKKLFHINYGYAAADGLFLQGARPYIPHKVF